MTLTIKINDKNLTITNIYKLVECSPTTLLIRLNEFVSDYNEKTIEKMKGGSNV